MRVALLSQHYVPEVTAARFRVEAFARALVGRGHAVDVIAPLPNHPEGVVAEPYRGRRVVRERHEGVDVTYVWTYAHPVKSTARRLASYGSYVAAGAFAGSLLRRPDVVLASSPPLSVAAAGAMVAARHRAPWVFDVRDLWPLAAEVMGELANPRALAAAERLERRLYRSADRIVAVTAAFERHIAARVEDPAKIELIRNGTTESWLNPPEGSPDREELGLPADRFVWAYAGNLGPSRRLDVAIEAARRLGEGFQLLLVGEGGGRAALEELAATLPPGRVSFRGLLEPGPTAELLRACDALFVPQRRGLGDFVPSKLFDYAATGRPLVVMADGETAAIAEDSGAAVTVGPEDVDGLVGALERLASDRGDAARLGRAGVEFAHQNSRRRQADRLADLLEEQALAGR